MLQMFTDETEYVIAASIEDVRVIVVDELRCSPECFKPETWRPMAEEQEFDYTDDDGLTRRKTVGEWVSTVGRGYFACEQ
jgi:hypothetical protein